MRGPRSSSPSSTRRCSPRSASTRTRQASRKRAASTSSASCSSTTGGRAWGRPGSTTSATAAPRDRQRKLFEAQLELAAELGKPVVIHTRDADADTADVLAGFDGTVVLHCFSSPGLLDTVARARLLRLLRRQRHLPEGGRPPRGCRAGARRADPGRDGQPLPRAAVAARPPERAGERRADRRRARAGARRGRRRARARRSTRTRRVAFSLP